MDASPISSRLRSATRRNNTNDWASLIVITTIYRTLQQYLSSKDLLNLSNVNRDLKLNYNYLCSRLCIDRWADNFEYVTRTIDRFPNLLSLNISQRVRNFDFLRHDNLQHLKSIDIQLDSYSYDFFSCVPQLLSTLVIRIDAIVDDESDVIVFNNIGKLKELKELFIVGNYLQNLKISLINLPESLQYININRVSYIDDVDMRHLVNLKRLCCKCLCIGIRNLRDFLPYNLETLELTVSFNKIDCLDISFLTNLKKLLLNVNIFLSYRVPQIFYDLRTNNYRIDIICKRKLHSFYRKISHYNITNIRELNLPCNLEIVDILHDIKIVNLSLSHLIKLKKLILREEVDVKYLTLPSSLENTLSLEINRDCINRIRINYI